MKTVSEDTGLHQMVGTDILSKIIAEKVPATIDRIPHPLALMADDTRYIPRLESSRKFRLFKIEGRY